MREPATFGETKKIPHVMDVMNMSENLHFVDACTDDHFRAMSLIHHALGRRDAPPGFAGRGSH